MNILGPYTSIEAKNKMQLYSKSTAFVSNIYENGGYVTQDAFRVKMPPYPLPVGTQEFCLGGGRVHQIQLRTERTGFWGR